MAQLLDSRNKQSCISLRHAHHQRLKLKKAMNIRATLNHLVQDSRGDKTVSIIM